MSTSIGFKLAAARKQKNTERENKKQLQKTNFFQNQTNYLLKQKKLLEEELSKLKSEIEAHEVKQQEYKNTLLQDLMEHQINPENDYSSELLSLGIELKTISPKAYSILSSKLPFPKESIIENTIHQMIDKIPEQLTNVEMVPELINNYKEKKNISKSEQIDACLAVDALYFTPNVQISEDGEITGVDFKNQEQSIIKKAYSLFTKDPLEFQNYLTLNGDKLIRSGFVFQIQPYDIRYKPFVVHIYPSVNGKANSIIIDLLDKVRELAKNRNINIKSYAFDGDNAYKELHRIYYESYIDKAIKEHKIKFDRTRKFRVVSDFLHIIKRLRYRLLSSLIHAGFTVDDAVILIEEWQEILQLENIVLGDEYYTKMHDKLPLRMFSVENFLKLHHSGLNAAACFWFPISLSILAMSAPDLGYNYRFYLLNTAFWFLVFYKECWNNSTEINLKQKKYKDERDVMFYTNDLLIEFTNTLHCQIQLMSTEENFSFDRNSTTPLEHKFGNARVRCNEIHTLQKFIQTISIMQTCDSLNSRMDFLKEFDQDYKIRGRSNSFGVTVESKDLDENMYSIYNEDTPESLEEEFKYTPQCFAKCMLCYGGFNVDYSNIFDPVEVLDWGINLIYQLSGDLPTQRKKKKISSSIITFDIRISDIKLPKRERKR